MSERTSVPYVPSAAEIAQAEKTLKELSERREYILARIKTSEGGNPTIIEARALGVPESELTEYALRFLEKDIREGYGLDTVRSIAEQSGVVTKTEVDALFEKVKAKMAVEGLTTETPEEKARKEAVWLAEMLELCGEKP